MKATTKKQATPKTITVTARYEVKRNNSIIYKVRNAEGRGYMVTINECGRPSCQDETGESCKGNSYGRQCYHVAGCLKLEASRRKSEEDQDIAEYQAWVAANRPAKLDRAAYCEEFDITA